MAGEEYFNPEVLGSMIRGFSMDRGGGVPYLNEFNQGFLNPTSVPATPDVTVSAAPAPNPTSTPTSEQVSVGDLFKSPGLMGILGQLGGVFYGGKTGADLGNIIGSMGQSMAYNNALKKILGQGGNGGLGFQSSSQPNLTGIDAVGLSPDTLSKAYGIKTAEQNALANLMGGSANILNAGVNVAHLPARVALDHAQAVYNLINATKVNREVTVAAQDDASWDAWKDKLKKGDLTRNASAMGIPIDLAAVIANSDRKTGQAAVSKWLENSYKWVHMTPGSVAFQQGNPGNLVQAPGRDPNTLSSRGSLYNIATQQAYRDHITELEKGFLASFGDKEQGAQELKEVMEMIKGDTTGAASTLAVNRMVGRMPAEFQTRFRQTEQNHIRSLEMSGVVAHAANPTVPTPPPPNPGTGTQGEKPPQIPTTPGTKVPGEKSPISPEQAKSNDAKWRKGQLENNAMRALEAGKQVEDFQKGALEAQRKGVEFKFSIQSRDGKTRYWYTWDTKAKRPVYVSEEKAGG